MAFYIHPIYFGSEATTGTDPGRTRILFEKDLAMPVHSKVIELLSEELDVQIWADADQSDNDEDRIVVENNGGEWDTSFTSHQRRNRALQIWAVSFTSDSAERLIDKVSYILRRTREDLRLISLSDVPGGYNAEGDFYFRGLGCTFYGR